MQKRRENEKNPNWINDVSDSAAESSYRRKFLLFFRLTLALDVHHRRIQCPFPRKTRPDSMSTSAKNGRIETAIAVPNRSEQLRALQDSNAADMDYDWVNEHDMTIFAKVSCPLIVIITTDTG